MLTSEVFVAVPTRGQIQWQTVTALEAARDYEGFGPILYQEGNLSVAITRNRIVEKFLATDATVLAMIDDDIAPPINFVELMLPALDDYDMVAMPHPFPHPSDPGVMCLSAFRQDEAGLEPIGLWQGVNECDAVATGCVLIRRDVFTEEFLGHAPFRMATDPRDRLQSDDFLFCLDMKRAGFRVGAFWNGQPVDHFRITSLAPIAVGQLNIPRTETVYLTMPEGVVGL